MITAEKLTKRYGKQLALDSLSFTIESGEAVALWGSNGAGKTTALRCLLGVLPFEGQLTVNGLDVRKAGKQVRAIVGYVPQETQFYDLTVRETLQFYARLKKVAADRIPAALEQVQLTEHAHKAVNALSGGLKQRLALAVAQLSDPPILLFDEPTANLDARAQYDFIHLVQQLNHAGKTIIFSSHRVDEVQALARRVFVLSRGQLDIICEPSELVTVTGLNQWLRIRVEAEQHSQAIEWLAQGGYTFTPNSDALYVRLNGGGKMAALRALEAAQIRVEDFDLVDHDAAPQQEAES